MSTKIQQDIVKIISESKKKPFAIAKESGCSGRALTYWLKGERVPRDIEVIDRVLNALGYKLILAKRGDTDEQVD